MQEGRIRIVGGLSIFRGSAQSIIDAGSGGDPAEDNGVRLEPLVIGVAVAGPVNVRISKRIIDPTIS
jgi:hypothetical protein